MDRLAAPAARDVAGLAASASCVLAGGAEPFDFSKRTGYALCDAMRERGLIVRPLGDVLVLMPAPAMPHDTLGDMLDIVTDTILHSNI